MKAEFELSWLRRELIAATVSDDRLMELLVLKGGNALNLIHHIGSRASLDLDFSLEGDLDDLEDVGRRLFRALKDRLQPHGLGVIDEKIEPRPREEGADPRWGGYQVEFKLVSDEARKRARGDLQRMRVEALSIGGGGQHKRVFKIQISKHEYCGRKEEVELYGLALYVYPPAMIAIEKLRSLCQQMDEYGHRRNPSPRARDFYDIHAVIVEAGVDLTTETNQDILRCVFEAKDVPLRLLRNLEAYREFHRAEWPDVQNAVGGARLEIYDFYFDYTIRQIMRLDALGVIDAPV